MDAEQLAKACAEAMWADDQASRGLGMELVSVGPGRAELPMTVTDRMVNGHKICHGGFIFTLADSAFAFACNTYNQRTVAQHCAITFLDRRQARRPADARAASRSAGAAAPASTTSPSRGRTAR